MGVELNGQRDALSETLSMTPSVAIYSCMASRGRQCRSSS